MKIISDVKNNEGVHVTPDKLQTLKTNIESGKKEIRELKQRKRTKEKELVGQMQKLD